MDLSPLFRSREYCTLYLGQFISSLGSAFTAVGMPLALYQKTASSRMAGLMAMGQLVPLVVSSLLGGVLADRVHRLRLLVCCELLLSLLYGSVALYLQVPDELFNPWVLVIAGWLSSVFFGLHRPSLEAMTPLILKVEMIPGIAPLNAFRHNFCHILGPVLAGFIIQIGGASAAFGVDSLSFLVAAGSLYFLKSQRQFKRSDAPRSSILKSLSEGFLYALGRKELLGTYLVDMVAMAFAMPVILFPVLVELKFGGIKSLGLLHAAIPMGSLLGVLVSTHFKKYTYPGRGIFWGGLGWCVAIFFLGRSPSLTLAMACLIAAGFSDMVSAYYRSMVWNLTIPNEIRGRMAGVEMISYLSGPLIGASLLGLVSDQKGPFFALSFAGSVGVLTLSLMMLVLRSLWNYRIEANSRT
jgi:MFS family permease